MAEPAPRPKLTLPPEERMVLHAAYARAGCILEYGSGGSTVLAAEQDGATVFTVESDAAWLDGLSAWFAENPARADLRLHHADIGPTRAWGYPKGWQDVAKWPGYPVSVWDRPDFRHPDVVLVDGRFRLACLLTTLARITRPVEVLVDDYAARPAYHRIEALVGAPMLIGRLARFELTPRPLPPEGLRWIIESFADPS